MTKVMVTGGSGFIGKHIIKELLAQGYDVRTSVRSKKRQAEIQELFPDSKIEFVMLDLTKDEGWNAALKNVDVLLHTASPFPMGEPKSEDELIKPAVEGTRRALSAARNADVKRIILTSSCVAMYKDPNKPDGEPANEDNWTDTEGKSVSVYEKSKTLAEKSAWDFVERHTDIKLTVINPGGVFGAPLDEHYGTSLEYVENFLNGKLPMLPPVTMPLVDVKDVAKMHVDAIKNKKTEGQRFAASSGENGGITMQNIAEIFAEAYPDRKISTKLMAGWLVKLLAIFTPDIRQMARAIGSDTRVSGAKAEKIFKFKFIDPKQMLLSSSEALIAMGAVEKSKK